LTEGTSPNPRWLIKFDSQNHKDEEIYERSFGKLLQAFDEEEPSSAPRKPAKPQVPVGRRGSTGKNGGTSSEGEAADEAADEAGSEKRTAKKVVQFTPGSNTVSDHSSTPETSTSRSERERASAREERSKRRQAKIDDETVFPEGETAGLVGVKRRPPPPPHQSKKRQREEDQGEAVKVKLLTGTLYLYRGRHRRAEFIRRV
jgi:hypothetical protein